MKNIILFTELNGVFRRLEPMKSICGESHWSHPMQYEMSQFGSMCHRYKDPGIKIVWTSELTCSCYSFENFRDIYGLYDLEAHTHADWRLGAIDPIVAYNKEELICEWLEKHEDEVHDSVVIDYRNFYNPNRNVIRTNPEHGFSAKYRDMEELRILFGYIDCVLGKPVSTFIGTIDEEHKELLRRTWNFSLIASNFPKEVYEARPPINHSWV